MFQGVKVVSKLGRARNVLVKQNSSARLINGYKFAPLAQNGIAQFNTKKSSSSFTASNAGSSLITTRNLSNEAQTMEFQAETRKLLDIVTHSIYTDKEVFLRELISNASDALEKYRYKQVTGEVTGSDKPLEINIYTDDKRKTLTIVDNGIGMSRDELIANLGTIAKSGSKQFVETLKNINTDTTTSSSSNKSAADGIIGQFGVGFYSSFMVSDNVDVQSLSATDTTKVANKWSSDGSGKFTIDHVSPEDTTERVVEEHGSCITMKLKGTCEDYADAEKIKRLVVVNVVYVLVIV